MNTQRLSLALTACFIGTATFSFAQEPVTKDAPVRRQAPAAAPAQAADAKKAPRRLFLSHTDVIGHAVTGVTGETTVAMGTVADLVVDGKNGAIQQIVIKAGEKSSTPGMLRAVPFNQLSWATAADGASTATLALDARAFDAIPAFNPKMLGQMAGKKALDAAADRLGKATDGKSGEEAADIVKGAREASATMGHSLLASNLAGLAVYAAAEREAFASVENYVINCQSGAVAFATVKAGENTYLVPFETLKVRAMAGAEGSESTLSIVAPTNAKGMAGAPMINADSKQTASNPRFRAMVYKHYGVEAPKARRAMTRDSASKVKGPTKVKGASKATDDVKKAVRKVEKVIKKVVDKA